MIHTPFTGDDQTTSPEPRRTMGESIGRPDLRAPRGWDPRAMLWALVWPYLAAIIAGVLTAIVVFAILAGWP